MRELIRRAIRIVYDFDRDTTDLTDRLDAAEKAAAKLAIEAQQLQTAWDREIEANKVLKRENEVLIKKLEELSRD